jgi:enamine deaminase RidA (YjgF/YER057c/UK114 family)
MNQLMPLTAAEFPPLKIALGADADGLVEAGLPVLGGEAVESLFSGTEPAGRSGALRLFRQGDWLLGGATVYLGSLSLEEAAQELYTDIFQAAHGLHLARIWQYVPAINAAGPGGLENYRIFCRARSLAFERHYGTAFKQVLPSASAVGAPAGILTVIFAASPAAPRHVENPLQVAAYEYPADYGPRAPSFARATVVAGPDRNTVFISGTAAIRGHATIAPHELAPQLDCTLENLAEISQACGLGANLDRDGRSTRHFKVYLRHASDQPAVARVLEQRLVTKSDHVSYLQADICREPLLVEIEATLFGV